MVDKPKQHYRFKCGVFIKATNFDEAQRLFMDEIMMEEPEPKRWHNCTCLGLGHRFNCPENPYNKGDPAYDQANQTSRKQHHR